MLELKHFFILAGEDKELITTQLQHCIRHALIANAPGIKLKALHFLFQSADSLLTYCHLFLHLLSQLNKFVVVALC